MCIFKYLVTQDDPQWVFSTTILTVNVTCFFLILVSYGLISFKTLKSARNSGRRPSQNAAELALQAKITAIILTDFLCWIPLSIVSFLHLGEVIDATSWYPFFSILIIPINSVINPLLYDSPFYSSICSVPGRFLSQAFGKLVAKVRSLRAGETAAVVASNPGAVEETPM